MTEQLVRLFVLLLGVLIVMRTLYSAVRVLVLPRSARDAIAAVLFLGWRRVFDWRANRANSYEERDRIMAFYAPISLLSLPVLWLMLIGAGYM